MRIVEVTPQTYLYQLINTTIRFDKMSAGFFPLLCSLNGLTVFFLYKYILGVGLLGQLLLMVTNDCVCFVCLHHIFLSSRLPLAIVQPFPPPPKNAINLPILMEMALKTLCFMALRPTEMVCYKCCYQQVMVW